MDIDGCVKVWEPKTCGYVASQNVDPHLPSEDYLPINQQTFIEGSLVGETSVLRTFRMSGKELVKERVSQRKS